MEGKFVILSVLIMSLVMAQIQVEAEKICCRNTRARNIFDSYRAQADVVNEYCKVGCTSSLCGPLTTVQNSGASEIGDGAVEQCANACSILCTTGSTKLAVETA
ncbi:hypothetical protein IGI04_005972 [Brassica rapa subsp. trilocularis]|uniref:Acidic protein n=3 Tax=Brassica TaxID=3705 RepID=M4EYU3_BRACM|nr:thionin [Brassica rapa]XP_048611228.1 thionin-like isoform X2 [Brassica napus]KAG5409653.1 hypothetical protein IGI04_005972 [Brassica rapa subsp. trilocularis]